MAEKGKIKGGPGRELAQAGREVFRSQTMVRLAEWGIRFTLGAVLSAGEIFGGFSPFGVGFVACSGSGTDGLCALLGAVLGVL